MIYQRNLTVLKRLYAATEAKRITWTEGKTEDGFGDKCYTAVVGGREIWFRSLYYEATNQIGADPLAIELQMPGLHTKFAIGTKGNDILMEVLACAFAWDIYDRLDPLGVLDDALPE